MASEQSSRRADDAPLTAEEVRALKPQPATEPPPFPPHVAGRQVLYFSSERGEEIRPSVKTERIGGTDSAASLWRVVVEAEGATAPYLLGVSSEPLPRSRSRSGARPGRLNAYRPPWLDLTYLPSPQRRPTKDKLNGRPGDVYEPLDVFPDDSRVVLTTTSWPWCCIGKIFTSDGDAGSGALVGDRTVITAQHMRPAKSIAEGHWWMQFVPLYWDGTSEVGLSSYVSDTRWYNRDDLEFNVSHDYMALRLFEPLGQQLGYFGANEFDDDWRGLRVFSGVGYPVDIAADQRPVVQFNWWMEDDDEDDDGQILETEASLTYGESGGPFFAWWPNNDPRIVGVVSGGGDFSGDHDNALAGGPNLIDLIEWARANWPA